MAQTSPAINERSRPYLGAGAAPTDLAAAARTGRYPIRRLARAVGLLYLAIFFIAPFPYLIGRANLVVPDDAAAPAANIAASTGAFRAGLAAESLVFLIEIAVSAMLFVILRPVSAPIALAATFARLAEAVIQAANLLTGIGVVLVLGGAGYLAAFGSDQLDALAMLFLDINAFGILLWGMLFGFHLVLLGYLVYRSGFWPRALGVLLLLAGLGYLAQSYGHLLAPQFDDTLRTLVMVLAIPAELAFTIWLLWKGIDVERWHARARAALA
jgi:hypothetical protein